MKILILLIAISGSIMIMSGCGKQTGEEKPEAQTLGYEETGCAYAGNSGAAFMDTGFYYQNANGQLMYFDEDTNQLVYVCGKPNCKHDPEDSDCDANIHGNGFKMFYRDGRLYYTSTIQGDSVFKIVVFSVKPDGSDRKQEATIGEVALSGMGYGVELYKHYAMVSYDLTDTSQKVELMDMDTGNRSVICENEDQLKLAYGGYFFCDDLYYGESEYDKEGNIIKDIFYRYNLKTKKVSKVYEGKMEARAFMKGYLIFSDGKAINRMPLAGGKVEKLFQYEGLRDLRYDGKYLYVEDDFDWTFDGEAQKIEFDDHWLKVMNLDGTLVDTIKWNNIGPCEFGDQRVLLFSNIETGQIGDLVMMKKSDIGGEHHFINLKNGEAYDNK